MAAFVSAGSTGRQRKAQATAKASVTTKTSRTPQKSETQIINETAKKFIEQLERLGMFESQIDELTFFNAPSILPDVNVNKLEIVVSGHENVCKTIGEKHKKKILI